MSNPIEQELLAHIDKHLTYQRKTGWVVHKTAGKAKVKGGRAGASRKGSRSRRLINIRFQGKARQLPEDKVVWYLANREWPLETVNHANGDLQDSRVENLTTETVNPVKKAWENFREHGLTKEVASAIFRYDPSSGKVNKLSVGGKWKEIIPYSDEDGYLRFRVLGRQLTAHRLAFLLMKGEIPDAVDHKNGKRDDNRWVNLRPASSSQNACNTVVKKNNKLGHKNIVQTKFGTFQVSVAKKNKKRVHRNFDNLEAAVAYRDATIRELHKSFASNRLRR